MEVSRFNLFAVCFLLGIVAQVNCENEVCPRQCLTTTQDSCRPNVNKLPNVNLEATCNSRYGAINHLEADLVKYATSHIVRSFEYLLMSTHFGNYEMNRAGFEKLFRGYSDSKWADSIELIKHITKRGGIMTFDPPSVACPESKNYEWYEIESLAKALDIEKSIMNDAYNIHEKATRKLGSSHDPEISHYMEEEFIEKEASNIRGLTGHITELSQMLAESQDNALSLYLFDEYLKDL